jgi:hypothetical protein
LLMSPLLIEIYAKVAAASSPGAPFLASLARSGGFP